MKAQDLFAALEKEFGTALKPEKRNDGFAYYWREKTKGRDSTRLVRISAAANGEVSEIKLAQSSRDLQDDVFLPSDVSVDQVASAVHLELQRLLSR